MTRVVVPRGAAGPTPSSQPRGTGSGSTSSSTTAVPPPPPFPSALVPQGPPRSIPLKEENPDAECRCPPDVELLDNGQESRKTSRLTAQLAAATETINSSSGREDAKLPEKIVGASKAEAIVPAVASPSSSNVEVPRAATIDDVARAAAGTSSSAPGLGSSNRTPLRTTISIRRIPKARTSPTNSLSNSPRSREEDGYNSADESNPWASGVSSFEDEEEREARFETELRRVKALEVKKMAPDGNCLFRAVSDQVYGDPEMHGDTRQMCIDYMEKERDHFSQFVTESFTAYCKRKRRDKVYGNNLEIQAMAEMYNRPIHIFSYSTDPINIFHGQYETDIPPIRLSYHRGNHYNSLYDPSRPSVGAGLGFGSLRGATVDRDQVKAAILAQQDQQIDNALMAEGRYYSDLELTEQEIERMVMEASRAEYLAQERHRQVSPEETSSSAGGEPSSSGAARCYNAGASAAAAAQVVSSASPGSLAMDAVSNRNSNVRMLLSMGFNYFRVMEANSIFGDDVNNMLCYLLETTGESMHRMKGKAAEK